MKTKKWNRKGFTLVELLVVIAIIVALAALATPAILKQRKKVDKVQAINNMKQVHLIMMDFEGDFNSFPDSNTAQQDQNLSAFTGQSSNQLLGQLIAADYTQSEEIFFAKGGNPSGNKKPDNVTQPVQQILQAGECGMAYVLVQGGSSTASGPRGLSSSDNGGIPYLCAPVQTGGQDAVFRSDTYDNRGVYLRIDGSAKDERLNPQNNRIKLPGTSNTLFQPGQGTVWALGDGVLTPTVLLPQ